jgi:iron(III) transport system permease protein
MGVIPFVGQRERRLPVHGVAGLGRWQLSLPGWPSLLVALIVAALMLLVPLYLVVRTLESGQVALELLARPTTLMALLRTGWLALAVTVGAAALALPIAWLTTLTDLPGRRFWTVAAALPLVLPSFIMAYLMVSILGPRGLAQQLLFPLTGLERLPNIYGFPGAFLVLTLMTYPYTLLTVRAALRRLDPSLVEAARGLGLTSWQAFWRVIVPQLRPALAAGSLLVGLYVLRDFGAVTMMRYDTFTRLIYIQYQSFLSRSLAAALALVLVVLTVLVLALEMRSRGRAQYARRSAGAARQWQPVALGRWRWPALICLTTVVTVSLVLPAGGLLYWLLRGLNQGPDLAGLVRPAWNSLSIGLAAAGLTMAVALPVAVVSVRRGGRLGQLAERLTYTGQALPGIVVALALVFFGTRFVPSLYQTLAMLLLAYTILFVPLAVGAARASLLQVSPSLEEAGRSLGQSPWQVFRRITLPLLRPGVLAGFALVFLTVMKELPATLILSPIGFRTLSTAVWSNISEAFFAQAAGPALLLILLSSLPLALLTLREK